MASGRIDAQTGPATAGRRIPIRLRFGAFVAVLLVLSTIVLGVAAFLVSQDMLSDQIDTRLSVVAADRQKLLLAYIKQQHERVALVASRTKFRQLAHSFLQGELAEDEFLTGSQKILGDALESTGGFQAIWLADPEGRVVTATDDDYLGRDFSKNEDFLAGRKGRHLGQPFAVDDSWQAYATAKATSSDGVPLGVVMVLLDVSPMVEFLSETKSLGLTGEVLVGTPADDKVRYVLPTRHDKSVSFRRLQDVPAMSAAVRGESGFINTTDYRNVEVLAAYRPVGYLDWGMVVKIDRDEAYQPVRQLGRLLFLIAALILGGGLIGAYLLARALTRRIVVLTESAVSAADGNLDIDITAKSSANDEIGDLMTAFRTMTINLRQQRDDLQQRYEAEHASLAEVKQLSDELKSTLQAEQQSRQRLEQLLRTIHEAAVQLGSSAAEIRSTVAHQSEAASRQASVIAETSATVAEVTQTAAQSTQRARDVAESAQRAETVSKSGREAVDESVAAIEFVRDQVESISANINTLGERAQTIGEIIDTVTDIAEQTNVLALNAAVEASRAGEHGKGFAVVAAEVKSLADQSKKATHKIANILREIQQASNSAVIATEAGTQSVTKAGAVIKKTEETIETLGQTIGDAARAGSQIVAAAGQQSTAMSQIHSAMEDIRTATDQALTATRETEQSAEQLNKLGDQLRELSDDAR